MVDEKKTRNLCCALVAVSLLFTQVYLTILPEISVDLMISEYEVQMVFMSSLAMFGISQLFYGPISDKRGKKNALVCGLVIVVMGNLVSASASTFYILFIGQLISGLGAGACSVVPRVLLKEQLSSVMLLQGISWLSIASTASAGLSPMIGSLICSQFGWKNVFLFLSIVAILMIYFSCVILESKQSLSAANSIELMREYQKIIINKVFIIFSSLNCIAYISTVFYLVITPFIYQEYFHYSSSSNSLVTFVCCVAYLMGNLILNTRILNVKFLILVGMVSIVFGCLLFLIPELHGVRYSVFFVISGILIFFGSGLLTPITYKMILNIKDFSVGVSSGAISSLRVGVCVAFLMLSLSYSFSILSASVLFGLIIFMLVVGYIYIFKNAKPGEFLYENFNNI